MSKTPDIEAFVAAVDALGAELRGRTGQDDLDHVRRVDSLGRAATLLGLATAWIAPNPISALAFGFGRTARLTIGHHVCHRAYDHIPGVPARFRSAGFGLGARRFVDWFDWAGIPAWNYTHNRHHAHTNHAERDPDLRCYEWVVKQPRVLRPLAIVAALATFKFTYYSPRIERQWRQKQGHSEAGLRGVLSTALHLARVMGPYGLVWFVLAPALFLPLGAWAALSVLVNSLLGEMITNAAIMMSVGTNHVAPELPAWSVPVRGREELALRSVLSTVDYPTGGDVFDVMRVWCGSHVAHHLWPDLTMLRYREAQPLVEALCAEHGIPYRRERLLKRFFNTFPLYLGREVHQPAAVARERVAALSEARLVGAAS